MTSFADRTRHFAGIWLYIIKKHCLTRYDLSLSTLPILWLHSVIHKMDRILTILAQFILAARVKIFYNVTLYSLGMFKYTYLKIQGCKTNLGTLHTTYT